MSELKTPYQLWYYSDGGYHLKELKDLNELPNALSELFTNDYYITSKVVLDIKELSK